MTMLNCAEVAERLQTTVQVARRMCAVKRKDRIPAKKVGREWRISEQELLKWLEPKK